MKAILTILTLGLFHAVLGQYSATSNPGIKSANCEDLVFNTRELMAFAYNTRCKTEAYPFISKDGSHLYFTNNQIINWVFYTHKDSINGIWSVPIPIEIANFNSPIVSSYLSEDHSTLYITTNEEGLFKCKSIEGSFYKFSQPEIINIHNTPDYGDKSILPFSCVSFTPDMNQMFLYLGVNGITMASFIRTGENDYTLNKILGPEFGYMGVFGDKGLSYYYTDPMYKNLLFCKKRPTLNEDFGSETYIAKTFESHLEILQLRIAEDAKRMVMVLSDDLWDKNDIYFYDFSTDTSSNFAVFDAIAYTNLPRQNKIVPVLVDEKDAPEPIHKIELLNQSGTDIAKIEIGNAFPNPAKNQFHIYFHVSGENPNAANPILVLLDQSGRIVYTLKLDKMQGEVMVMPEHVSSGVYYVRIDYNGLSSPMSKITLSF